MVSVVCQMLGLTLAIIGFLGTIVVFVLPMWKVTVFIGANTWEGLWMSCVVQSTGQTQCKIYDPLLPLPQDFQAARVLMVIAIIMSAIGVRLGIAGSKITNFVKDPVSRAKATIAAGNLFIIAGVLVLVPMCWSAMTIIRDFYNPFLTNPQIRELGPALYIGWEASALLILGGRLLCTHYTHQYNCPPNNNHLRRRG